ncbi:MAG: cyclic nucleotide-binding domain-containing protein [Desulfatitalea sp.]|nr:cyclic nucleotide-binding domain-containing protein [Desulfatitalea sp.]NNK02375.1 cyclic nucleotide-binding domain-containing protein [Desulfatitalea sp.]
MHKPTGVPMTTAPSVNDEQIQSLIRRGRTDEAIELLAKSAINAARQNNFEMAESCRDQMYELDSMALAAIVSVNEIIEIEKSKALTPDRRRLWACFLKGLDLEEANAFFFSLKEFKAEPEQTILRQGETNDRLYLVNSGQLRIIHDNEDKQILIQTIGAGDIFGEDTFFSINVCIASVITNSAARISYLERDRLEGMKIQYSHLENHLMKICGTGQKLFSWVKNKGIDRRTYRRINFPTKISFQILSADKKALMQRAVTAELWDLSKTGLSFYFQSKNRQAVQRLMGKTIGVRFSVGEGEQSKVLALTGTVQGVQNHPLDEYSVHLKLRRNFSDDAMRTLRRLSDGK